MTPENEKAILETILQLNKTREKREKEDMRRLRIGLARYAAGQKRHPTGESSRDRPSRGLPKKRPITLAKVTAFSDDPA